MITINGQPLLREGGLNPEVVQVVAARRHCADPRYATRMAKATCLQLTIRAALPASGRGLTYREVAVRIGAMHEDSAKKVPTHVVAALKRLEAKGLVRRQEVEHPVVGCPMYLWRRVRRRA